MGAIDDIKERLDIVEIITSMGVALRRTGRSFVGFCPFHPNSRTPAFTVYPDSQTFYCFGCHASGTVFDFVMKKQGLDFRETLQLLAVRAGVQLQERNAAEQQEDRTRTKLIELNTAAALYFNYVLLNFKRAQPGRDYGEKRGISPEMIEAFQLGFSLDDWTPLFAYLTERKGYTPEEVVAAGLALSHEQRGYYDRFRGRLIFPIRNVKGEVVGFGGRALGDAQPKYLNTPQTLVFDKSSILYGMDRARDAIRSNDAAVVVEGYVDVITAHQYGFRNVVAPLGTALNRGHVAMLKRLTNNVYLALDADAAGQRATLRGLTIAEESGEAEEAGHAVVTAQGVVMWQNDLNLRIIRLTGGRDPDEVIRANPEEWQELVAHAAPVMDFYIDAYTAGQDLSQPQVQRQALDRLLPLLSRLDATQQRVYIARLEQVVGIRAELILDLLRGGGPRGDGKPQRPGEPQRPAQGAQRHPTQGKPSATARKATIPAAVAPREDYLLALAFRFPPVERIVDETLTAELTAYPRVANLLRSDLASLLERPQSLALWQAWQREPATQHDDAGLFAWVAQLEPALHEFAESVINLKFPRSLDYRFRQDTERLAREMRLRQTRTWQSRIGHHIDDMEPSPERDEAQALNNELAHFLAIINKPRRHSLYPDLRDTLGREGH